MYYIAIFFVIVFAAAMFGAGEIADMEIEVTGPLFVIFALAFVVSLVSEFVDLGPWRLPAKRLQRTNESGD
jgi:uncharacterized membrane protein YtjA (UPF0391 family)